MSIPSFTQLGNKYRDFFSQGYYFGVIKLGTSSTTCSGRQYNLNATHQIDNGSSFWELETQRTYKKSGLHYVSKYNTDGILISDIFYPFKYKTITFGFGGDFDVLSKVKSGRISLKFNHENATLDLGAEGLGGREANLFNGSLVLGYIGYIAGCQCIYDNAQGVIKKTNLAAGYEGYGVTIHGAIENFETGILGIHHKNTKDFETGIVLTCKPNELIENTENSDGNILNKGRIDLGLKYRFNPFTAFKAKFSTNSDVGLGYEIRLNEGATLTLGTLINLTKISEGGGQGNKTGIALDFEN